MNRERKSLLKRIVRRTKNDRIRFTDYIVGDGLALFAQLERQQPFDVMRKSES